MSFRIVNVNWVAYIPGRPVKSEESDKCGTAKDPNCANSSIIFQNLAVSRYRSHDLYEDWSLTSVEESICECK